MRIILLLMGCWAQFALQAQDIGFGKNAKIYLVRHAEKESGQDPLLTEAGNKRAGDLARVLKDKKVKHIFVTQFKRTQNTGDSLRLQFGVDTVHYMADTSADDLIKQLKLHHDLNSTILVIGHSNTIPLVIRKLALPDYPIDYIPDNDFDDLFLLTFKKGKAVLTRTKYGAASGESAKMK